MPRSNAGTYTLPPGTPFVTGTTISSAIVNSVDSDLGTEITNSLDRNGRGQMLAPLALADGSATAPALTFNSEPTSGIYRAGTNIVALQVAGNTVLQGTLTGIVTALGINATSSVTNGAAFTGVGNGTSAAVVATGGASGASGVLSTGTGTSPGITGVGGPSNGAGVKGTGTGSGAGVLATGGASGGVGVTAVPGTTGLVALDAQGNITLSGAALSGAPNVSVSGPSTLTYATAVRVAGSFKVVRAVGAQTINCSYNVGSIALQANKTDILVTFANYSAASATSYWATYVMDGLGIGSGSVPLGLRIAARSTTSLTINLYNASTGGTITDVTTLLAVPTIDFEIKGF